MQELVQLTAKNSSKLNKFLHSEVDLIIQHIIVQDQDGQNNNIKNYVSLTGTETSGFLYQLLK